MRRAIRIGVVAPGTRIDPEIAQRVSAIAAAAYPERVEIVVHPQCYLSSGHFAGDDAARLAAFVAYANDPGLDAVWFARGGYGACRIAEAAIAQLGAAARTKAYLGYSDAGALLAGLYRAGFANLAHGPMPVDVVRHGGDAAVKRGLAWLVERAPAALEPSLKPGMKTAAFNIMILSSILGTPLEPDLSDHVIMLEDVGEYLYRIDRALFHISASANVRKARGLMLGRVSETPENDKPFGADEEAILRHWCERAGLAYLGRADIGHDVDNKVVPFGLYAP